MIHRGVKSGGMTDSLFSRRSTWGNVYVCIDGPVTEASARAAHYLWHRTNGEEPCPQSRKEVAAYQRLRECGTLDGWEYIGGGVDYDCLNDDGSVQGAHAGYHRKYGEPVCRPSLSQEARYNRKRKSGSAEGVAGLHFVYQYTFLDGDRYYGITSRQVRFRHINHLSADSAVGRKLRSGAGYVLETICECPNREAALEVERLAVMSGNPWGKILNAAVNR